MGAYGFTADGRQRIEEYCPNALVNTYKGVSGYIYRAESITDSGLTIQIRDAAASSEPVEVSGVEFVPDAYEAILQAERDGLIDILRYEDMPEAMREWRERTIQKEFENAVEQPEYRHFLRGNFPDIIKE